MLLTLDKVHKAFGDHVVLREVTWRLLPGQSWALIGPNGAGKTTLLNILAGLMSPDRGELTWGDNLDHTALGLVTHQPCIYSELTARENLHYFAKLYRLPAPASRARELLAEMGLETAADRPVGGFSRGMQQRLAIARALLAKPRLLLLDEPFSGLDHGGVHMLCGQLQRLQAQGLTLVVSTHLLELAEQLTHRACLLNAGRLIEANGQSGLTDQYREMFLQPKT